MAEMLTYIKVSTQTSEVRLQNLYLFKPGKRTSEV